MECLQLYGEQHLETFKTIENVAKTKLELIDSLTNEAFINYEDDNIKKANIVKSNIKYGFDKDNCGYYADDISITADGSKFKVYTKDREIIEVKTKLLGEHNITNIVGAVAIAKELGLTSSEIEIGIRYLEPVEHRLELKKQANGLIIIDDAYNSNVKGAKMALDVLKRFEGKQRILITPGIVDLGDKLEEYNMNFGMQAAESADYVILVGEKQAEPIKRGLETKKYPNNQLFIAKDINEAIKKMQEIANSNTVVLLENDLPDNYL